MKNYAVYEQEYLEAIKGAKPDDFVVKKDLWICFKLTEDLGVEPCDLVPLIRELEIDDPKLADTLTSALQKIFEEE